MSKAKKVTPLMKQYNAIKVKYPDALLLFRVGDFYETFGQDAVKAAEDFKHYSYRKKQWWRANTLGWVSAPFCKYLSAKACYGRVQSSYL